MADPTTLTRQVIQGSADSFQPALDPIPTAPLFPRKHWEPLTAWRLQSLYGPVSDAIRSVVSPLSAAPLRGSSAGTHVHILQVGGHPTVLRTFMALDGADNRFEAPLVCDVTCVSPEEAERLPFHDRAVDCAVAIDWLSDVSASQRERSIAELCRVAREGVVIVNPCQGPEVAAAARAVNDLHRAARGLDHPRLGRLIELGLPDAETVRGWLERFFPNVDVRMLGDIALWQAAEALTLVDESIDAEPSAADIAAAALYPVVDAVGSGAPGYRTLIVAALRPSVRPAKQPSVTQPPDLAAVTMHHALEAAAQRRALDALVRAVTTERERERDEFRASIASLAVELRDLDGRAEFLARELRGRDQTIANQQLLMAEDRQRAADLDARLADAHATIARQQAALAEHARHAVDVDACVAEAQRFVAQQHAVIAEGERRAADLEASLVDAQRTIADQQTVIAEQMRHAIELDACVAEAQGFLAHQNSVIADDERRTGDFQACLAEAQRFVDHLNAAIAAYAESADDLRARLAEAERLAVDHEKFVHSRAGRALRAYGRVKNRILGRR